MSVVSFVSVSGLGFWCKAAEITEPGQQLELKAAKT